MSPSRRRGSPPPLASAARASPSTSFQRAVLGRVVEGRLADRFDLDPSVDALHRANEQMLRIVRPELARVHGPSSSSPAGGERQRVADDEPARVGHPARLEHVRAGDVAARHRGSKAPRPDPEGARPAVEQGGEDARRVEAGQAEPLHRPVRGDQGAGVAIGEEAVVADRVEVGSRGPRSESFRLGRLASIAGNAIDTRRRAPRWSGSRRALRMHGLVSLTVVGSIAFDSVSTPFGERERMLGGSAVHFALAASFFTDVHVVGPVGDDFGEEHVELLRSRGVDVADIERVAGGRDVLLARPLRGRPQRRPHRRHAAGRVRRLRAEAVGGVEPRRRACSWATSSPTSSGACGPSAPRLGSRRSTR